jgi:conjugal transfer pilus assembly protein TrbC
LIFFLCIGLCSQKIVADLKVELKNSLRNQNLGKAVDNIEADLLIFISLGMPDELLLMLAHDAELTNAQLILRGLPKNSFNDFAKRLFHLKEKGLSASVQIHPILFQEYNITGVPAFVLKDEQGFDKVSGNVSLEYVLRLFEDGGSLKSKKILAKFGDNKNV